MIKISTAELRRFISASKNIKFNNLLPIYSYVKLVCEKGVATFYKSNGHSFLICEVVDAEFKGEFTYIIDEKTLFGFVSFSHQKDITIKLEKENIIIDDGVKDISCLAMADHYPAIQPIDNDGKKLLDSTILESLFLAKSHISQNVDKSMRSWTSLVHLTKSGKLFYVAGLNGSTSYIKSFKGDYPEFHLDAEVVSVVAKYPAVHYVSAGNYDCFDTGDVCYGFIKTEIKNPDIAPIVEKFKSDDKFTIDRNSVVDFCEMVLSVNDSNIPPEVCFSDGGKNSVILKFSGISGNQHAKYPAIPAKDKTYTLTDFYFQPKNMLLVLKDLGVDEVTLSYTNHNLIVSSIDDKNYVGSIMELSKL